MAPRLSTETEHTASATNITLVHADSVERLSHRFDDRLSDGIASSPGKGSPGKRLSFGGEPEASPTLPSRPRVLRRWDTPCTAAASVAMDRLEEAYGLFTMVAEGELELEQAISELLGFQHKAIAQLVEEDGGAALRSASRFIDLFNIAVERTSSATTPSGGDAAQATRAMPLAGLSRQLTMLHVQLQRTRGRMTVFSEAEPDDVTDNRFSVEARSSIEGSCPASPARRTPNSPHANSRGLSPLRWGAERPPAKLQPRLSVDQQVLDLQQHADLELEGQQDAAQPESSPRLHLESPRLPRPPPPPPPPSDVAAAAPAATGSGAVDGGGSGALPPPPKPRPLQKALSMGSEVSATTWLLPPRLVGTYSCHGIDAHKDKINQDAACICFPLSGDERAAMFLVVDGHGTHGHAVADAVVSGLAERAGACSWDRAEEEVTAQLVAAFEGTQEALKEMRLPSEPELNPAFSSGVCAVCLVVRAGRLSVAHAGDCRAVLGAESHPSGGLDASVAFEAVELTEDHAIEAEAARLAAAGAMVRGARYEPYYEPARAYADLARPWEGPGLAMSRSLGDLDADAIGIVATPTVSHRRLDLSTDRFVVLASDGIWEFLSSDDVVDIVGGFVRRGEPAADAARFLIAKAALQWKLEEGDYRDDITAIVIYLDELTVAQPAGESGEAPDGSAVRGT